MIAPHKMHPAHCGKSILKISIMVLNAAAQVAVWTPNQPILEIKEITLMI